MWCVSTNKLHKTKTKYTALPCRSVFLLRRHLFLKIDWTFYKICCLFIKFSKSMPALVICIVSRGHKTSTTQFLHILCRDWPTHAQNAHENEALLFGSDFLPRRHLFRKIDWTFRKIWWFLIKFYSSMPAIVISTASRGHKTWQTQCLHRLCVEIGPPMPKTYFKMRRCYADLIFGSGCTRCS